MANDPAFLFYPGDYLRDTQNLSEKSQVAYDRIMCEHMRNICISQAQLKFFTKRLNEEEIEELMLMLVEENGCYQIKWVADSINKRREYSESRRKNREGKTRKHIKKTSKTYDKHMENEIENENINDKKIEVIYPWESEIFLEAWKLWKEYKSKEFKFVYKSKISEQAAINKLHKLSGGKEKDALNIISNSMANGWQGFFSSKQANQSDMDSYKEELLNRSTNGNR